MASSAPVQQHTQEPPPHIQVLQKLFGKHVSYCISVVARLGVADHMSTEPVSVEALAAKTGAQASELYRVMRMLATMDIFAETSHGHFAATPQSQTLRSDAPGSTRYLAMQFGDPWSTRPFEYFTDCVVHGGDGVTKAFNKPIFEILKDSPEQAANFNRSMSGLSGMEVEAILEAFDFGDIKTMADVGGGHGALLSAIMARNPQMLGVVFDLPEVIAGMPDERVRALKGRLTVAQGSFFEDAPSGCDAVIMKHILHDWDDERCRTILRNVRKRIPSDGRLLVCEMVVSDDSTPEMAKILDIEMMVLTEGGKERTEREFTDLFASAGFKLERIVRTPGPICVIEASPA